MLAFSQLKAAYDQNWQQLHIRPEHLEHARAQARRVLNGKSVYKQVEARTGVPWWFVGLCHHREANLNFGRYLGNGERLDRVTTIVPKGRGPFLGPDAFVDGAVDALKLEKFAGAADWSIARTLYRLEGFNGYGYHSRGVNSPYLYGGSTLYGPPEARAGKFVRDHVFDPHFVDPQLGTAVVLKALMEIDPSVTFDAPLHGEGFPEDPDAAHAPTVAEVQQWLNALGADPQLSVDGRNGPRTREAISRFQQDNGLADTGVLDPATVAAIRRKATGGDDADAVPAHLELARHLAEEFGKLARLLNGRAPAPGDGGGLGEMMRLAQLLEEARRAADPQAAAMDGGSLKMGEAGARVLALQTALRNAGYPLGAVDSVFGSLTRAALLAFQADQGLPTTGVADKATLAALDKSPSRPLSRERATSGETALRQSGSRIVASADNAKLAGLVSSILGALGVTNSAVIEVGSKLSSGAGQAASSVRLDPSKLIDAIQKVAALPKSAKPTPDVEALGAILRDLQSAGLEKVLSPEAVDKLNLMKKMLSSDVLKSQPILGQFFEQLPTVSSAGATTAKTINTLFDLLPQFFSDGALHAASQALSVGANSVVPGFGGSLVTLGLGLAMRHFANKVIDARVDEHRSGVNLNR